MITTARFERVARKVNKGEAEITELAESVKNSLTTAIAEVQDILQAYGFELQVTINVQPTKR